MSNKEEIAKGLKELGASDEQIENIINVIKSNEQSATKEDSDE